MAVVKMVCRHCGKVEFLDDSVSNICCDEPMEKIEACRDPLTAEQDRPFNEDGPCDDGRAG
jgi:DNA polymerase III alpha subunit (gram-positive type)